jgi:hypothetical protein
MKQDLSRADRLGQLLRHDPQQPAMTEFSPVELEAARAFCRGMAPRKPLKQVTLQEAASWVAQAGQVDVAQRIDVTDSIALKRGLATVALYVALNADQGPGAPQHSSHA